MFPDFYTKLVTVAGAPPGLNVTAYPSYHPSGIRLDDADWINSFWWISFTLQIWLLFQMGQFYYAAKAFDALEKLDPDTDYWEGKRGACVGVFQLILANKESKYVSFPHCLDSVIMHLLVVSYLMFVAEMVKCQSQIH